MMQDTQHGINAGAVSIESERAIAEARGQMQLAKMFPRNTFEANAELMEACKQRTLAEVAFYSVPRAGGSVTGPSIRLAEEIARCYGNFEYGHRELSRTDKKSEVEVYAWDKERNNRSIRQLTVYHVQDTKNGPKELRDQKDIDDKISNVASKQVRGRILALVPKWMVQGAIEACRDTLVGGGELTITEQVTRMIAAFAKFGVKPQNLADKLGHPLANVTPDDLVTLRGIYTALNEGAKTDEYFSLAPPEANGVSAAIEKLATKAQPPDASAATPPPPPKPPAAKPKATPVAPPPPPAPAPEPAPPEGNEAPPPDDLDIF